MEVEDDGQIGKKNGVQLHWERVQERISGGRIGTQYIEYIMKQTKINKNISKKGKEILLAQLLP